MALKDWKKVKGALAWVDEDEINESSKMISINKSREGYAVWLRESELGESDENTKLGEFKKKVSAIGFTRHYMRTH